MPYIIFYFCFLIQCYVLTSVSADEQRAAADPYKTFLILPTLWTKSFCFSQEYLLLQTLASLPNTQL